MSEQMRRRVITFLAAGIGYGMSQLLVNRFINIPEEPGIKDDVLEALLKAGTTATSTVLASIIVRWLLRNWF